MTFGLHIFQRLSKEDKILSASLKSIIGFKPKRIALYIAALTHRSVNDTTYDNNERLEFLGDAFIGTFVGEYLFKKYPTQNEGFLTEMRSKIVSRQSLNDIAVKMGLPKLVRYNFQDKVLRRSHIFGNALEALVGAIYLDKGFEATRTFIYKNLLTNYVDVDVLEVTDFNFKNKFYTWAQKLNYEVNYKTLHESFQAGRKVFEVGIYINNILCFKASGYSKKEASQTASHIALDAIEANPEYTPTPIDDASLFEKKNKDITIEDQETIIATTENDLTDSIVLPEDETESNETASDNFKNNLTEVE